MPNMNAILNEQIRRIARREINAHARVFRRLTAQHRRDIASLKRRVTSLVKTVNYHQRPVKSNAVQSAGPNELVGVRFRSDGLRTHRTKLGISAEDYGLLVGSSGQSIYHWETGKSRPRKKLLAKLVELRGLGKREALKRLSSLKAK